MIETIFEFGGELVGVNIKGSSCMFATKQFGGALAPIEGLKLDYAGVCREFPDLELRKDWREEAIKRFKDKIKKLKNEKERMDYVINDLKKFGYKPVVTNQSGFRPKRF